MTDEEALLRQIIAEIADAYTQAYRKEVRPYVDRLVLIESMKPVRYNIEDLMKAVTSFDS